MVNQFGTEFIFKHWTFKAESGRLELHYHDVRYGDFSETFGFPPVEVDRVEALGQALHTAIDNLHWMAGISYYKTSLAQSICFTNQSPGAEQSRWLTETWQAGLAELAHQNGLGWLSHIEFPTGEVETAAAEALNLQARSLVAIGGGKDSLVSIEAIKAMGETATLFQVGSSDFIKGVASQTGLPLLQVTRQVDSRLREVNQQGAFNGHIPITAINACVAVVAALLCDFDAVVFSNERSADQGNLQADNGQWINHQYSKSLAFEAAWQRLIHRHIACDLFCFSLLRPFSELKILDMFAKHDQYFEHFSSCNRNFHLAGSQNQHHHWCGQCPKCAFVFLCLAPFVSKAVLMKIFQKDLLADEQLSELFTALLGWNAQKPFECVGEVVEGRLAIQMLGKHPDWKDHPWVNGWLQKLPAISESEAGAIFAASPKHIIPAHRQFREVIAHEAD